MGVCGLHCSIAFFMSHQHMVMKTYIPLSLTLFYCSWWAQWSHFACRVHQTPPVVRQAYKAHLCCYPMNNAACCFWRSIFITIKKGLRVHGGLWLQSWFAQICLSGVCMLSSCMCGFSPLTYTITPDWTFPSSLVLENWGQKDHFYRGCIGVILEPRSIHKSI